jgi:hypothetical protein
MERIINVTVVIVSKENCQSSSKILSKGVGAKPSPAGEAAR